MAFWSQPCQEIKGRKNSFVACKGLPEEVVGMLVDADQAGDLGQTTMSRRITGS